MPTKVSFFLWTAALGRILTIDNLRRYQVVVVDLYCMCKRGEETIDHLIMHCPIARELWNLVFPLFGVQWGWWNFWPPGFTSSTSIDLQ